MNTTNTWTWLPESQDTTHKKTIHISSSNQLEWTNEKINDLKAKEKIQKSKEQIQTEIMSYFIQHPDESPLMSMKISKDPEDLCEIINFQDAEYEDKNLNMLFNWWFGQQVWWITIKADETWEKWEEFAKELIIDRASNAKWMLFVWKKWFKIEKVDFEDINKYETQYETYFVYKKNGKTYIKIIKTQNIDVDFRVKDSDIVWQMNFWSNGLDNLNLDLLLQQQEELMKLLQEAKQNWNLDEVIEIILSQTQVSEQIKNTFKAELYKMAQN